VDIWSTVEDAYAMKQAHIIESLTEPIDIAIDGEYDSPGFSSELCVVLAIERTTKQIIDFAVVHKSETQNVSGRMELFHTSGMREIDFSYKITHRNVNFEKICEKNRGCSGDCLSSFTLTGGRLTH
jgi:hypothetical protein